MATKWYRRKSWTEEDQKEFFAKLARARKDSRPQYLKIQAIEFIATKEEHLLSAAEFLIDKLFNDYPEDRFNKPGSLHSLGHIYKIRKDYNRALDYYKQTIDFEKIYSQVKTQAYLDYSELIAEQKRTDLFPIVEEILLSKKDNLSFPIEEYKAYSILSMIYKQSKDFDNANYYADLAEIAAAKTISGFRYHSNLGLVNKSEN